MRAVVLTIAACLLASCMSAPRAREARCLGATMMDTWQAENELTYAESVWRAAQQARSDRALPPQDSSASSVFIANGYPSAGTVAAGAVQGDGAGNRLPELAEERTLYQRVIAAQTRYRETAEWYSRVSQRVQTRIEEDDMLFPVLGMLATSTAIVFYPLVRWNVRSVLWEGIDPDAEDDPVQVFCAARLGQDARDPE